MNAASRYTQQHKHFLRHRKGTVIEPTNQHTCSMYYVRTGTIIIIKTEAVLSDYNLGTLWRDLHVALAEEVHLNPTK